MNNILKKLRGNSSMLTECVKMSWEQITGNRMRSFLTTLGIIIGITAVIALITIVEGITGEMMNTFDEMGAGTLNIVANGSVLKSGLSEDDMEKIAEIENIRGISPKVSATTSIVKNDNVLDDITLSGKSAEYFFQNDEDIILGRVLTPMDMGTDNYVCIIDEDLQKSLFSKVNPIGQIVKISGHSYIVVGVSENDDSISNSFNSTSENDGTVMVPYKNAMKTLGIANVTDLEVYVDDTEMMDETTGAVEACLDNIFNNKDDTYFIGSMDSMLDSFESMKNMLTAMLAGIASISLVVGGIGIMNMMLVSVSERTKEIGLRKALGAEPEQIQLQFVVEAIFLSLIGGIVGIVLGLMISYAATFVIDMEFKIVYYAIALGFGFSAIVGIGFGWGPSKKASNLNPIDALRSD